MAPAQQPPVASTATLHALTEKLASHGRSLSPLISSNFAATLSNFTPSSLAAAAAKYNQPAPPPALPILQLVGRHQDPAVDKDKKVAAVNAQPNGTGQTGQVTPNGARQVNGKAPCRCPSKVRWRPLDQHEEVKCTGIPEEELDGFVADMGIVVRREFDCWVEQCWTEAFHHLFTRTLPVLVIHLILTGANPSFLRKSVVHGGWPLDHLFQSQMLDLLYTEMEMRLSGLRPPEPSLPKPATASAAAVNSLAGAAGLPSAPNPGAGASTSSTSRDGICFHSLSADHGVDSETDDHGLCLCPLTSCLFCFEESSLQRKGPSSLLPYELSGTLASEGWSGQIESPDQARIRVEGIRPMPAKHETLPAGQGFVRNPKPAGTTIYRSGAPMFPHPQMTDVLAVEEHLRWRLKELGAVDPALDGRYGPSTNHPTALEGLELPEDSEDGDSAAGTGLKKGANAGATGGGGKMVKVTRGKGKVRRAVNGAVAVGPGAGKKEREEKEKAKKDAVVAAGKNGGLANGASCYLPKEWAEEDPQVRNMAVVLTFRHFVKLLHQISTSVTPFSYPSYSRDIEDLERVHPIALYRRLAEPAAARRRDAKAFRAWVECMDKWGEELGSREKTRGNMLVNESHHGEAVEYYTRALSLDPKKTVYLSNRAVALNTLGAHAQAEQDCTLILAKDGKNGKALYQRALARSRLGRFREAEADLREVLKYQPGNESAKKLHSLVKVEVAKLPKLTAKEAMEF